MGNNGNSDRLYFCRLQNHYGWWLQPCNEKTFAPWKKSYDKLKQHVKNQRQYFADKDPYSKSYDFSSSLYGCENGTIKKAEHQRIDAFELWCWRRLLRIPLTARRLNQLILKEISPEYSLEGLMLKLKLQYFGHLMQRTNSLEKTWCWERLKAGGEGDDRGWDGWMTSLTQWTWVWANSGRWWGQEAWCAAVHGVTKSWTQLSNWMTNHISGTAESLLGLKLCNILNLIKI